MPNEKNQKKMHQDKDESGGDVDFSDKPIVAKKTSNDEPPQQWDIAWFDTGGLTPEILSSLLPWQRVNHFLGNLQNIKELC